MIKAYRFSTRMPIDQLVVLLRVTWSASIVYLELKAFTKSCAAVLIPKLKHEFIIDRPAKANDLILKSILFL